MESYYTKHNLYYEPVILGLHQILPLSVKNREPSELRGHSTHLSDLMEKFLARVIIYVKIYANTYVVYFQWKNNCSFH